MTNPEQIKVCIVDDHEIFRNGLKMVVNKIKNARVVIEASGGKEFLESIEKEMPDIVIMDIEMPEMNGIETTRKALAKYPDLKIVALTMFNEDHYVESMIDAGVKGFLLKNINREKLEKAINTVYKGGNYYSEELWEFFTRRIAQEDKKPDLLQVKLTSREQQILEMLVQGMGNKDIADKLFLSERTIIGHKSNLLSKTQCKNTLSMMAFAIKNKLVSL